MNKLDFKSFLTDNRKDGIKTVGEGISIILIILFALGFILFNMDKIIEFLGISPQYDWLIFIIAIIVGLVILLFLYFSMVMLIGGLIQIFQNRKFIQSWPKASLFIRMVFWIAVCIFLFRKLIRR